MTPPSVYNTPPRMSKKRPVVLKAFDNGENAKMIIQPNAIYIAVDNHLGQLNQTILNKIPDIATVVTIPKITQPVTPFKVMRQNGAYDPAIKTKIIEWSSLLKKAITLSFAITMWYVAEAEYSKIILMPKITTDVMVTADGFEREALMTRASRPTKERMAPAK